MTDSFHLTFPVRCPGRIFVELWTEAAATGSTYTYDVVEPKSSFRQMVQRTLAKDDLSAVCDSLDRLRQCEIFSTREVRGRKLCIMDEIDRAFLAIHPRSRSHSADAHLHTPAWLKALAKLRKVSGGYFFEDENRRLVLRGPLMRAARRLESVSADSLPDRFAALTVVPRRLPDANSRDIDISHRIVTDSGLYGAGTSTSTGNEKVMFVPVLETRGEIQLKWRLSGGGRPFVDCRSDVSIDSSARVIDALNKESGVAIVIAPEFTMTEVQAAKLSYALSERLGSMPNLIVAGSGQTNDRDEDLSWNETQVMNGLGKVLWRQRKLWPAAIRNPRATEFGLPDPGGDKIFEETAAGREMIVADVDGFGRFLILICQDLENGVLPNDLIRRFQPDWVVSPVLDRGLEIGRWAHQAAWRIGNEARTRILVGCSEALAPLDAVGDKLPLPCGLAVGPSQGDDHDEGRLVAAVVASGSTARFATVTWRSDETVWQRTCISAEDARS